MGGSSHICDGECRHIRAIVNRAKRHGVQGSRDGFGTPSELAPILTLLIPAPSIHVVDGGDHSLVVNRRDPHKQTAANDVVYGVIARWIKSVIAR